MGLCYISAQTQAMLKQRPKNNLVTGYVAWTQILSTRFGAVVALAMLTLRRLPITYPALAQGSRVPEFKETLP